MEVLGLPAVLYGKAGSGEEREKWKGYRGTPWPLCSQELLLILPGRTEVLVLATGVSS